MILTEGGLWLKKKQKLLLLLRIDFINSYSPFYPSQHASLEPTVFSLTTSLKETRPSRARNEIREKKVENGGQTERRGVQFRSRLIVPFKD